MLSFFGTHALYCLIAWMAIVFGEVELQDRKNILFLTNRVPYPPDKGDKIRTFHQLAHLARSHNVYCGCFADSPDDADHARMLRRWCKEVLVLRWTKKSALLRAARGWLRGLPVTRTAYCDTGMFDRLEKWAQRVPFDAAVAFSTSMATYAWAIPSRRRILDMCDVDSEKWFGYAQSLAFPASNAFRAEGRRLRVFERECLDRFDATIAISQRERLILDPAGQARCLHVVPNGVRQDSVIARHAWRCGPVIGFVGSMNYRPNVEGMVWFVRQVWPIIRAAIPQARLLIVGRNPTRRVRRLSRSPGVEVTGEVTDVRDAISQCRLIVAPLHIARGMQNKVLEAMAEQRPVVATSAVAGGMNIISGRDMLIADDAPRFAGAVIGLCRDDTLCRRVAESGHHCVASHYRWEDVLPCYEQIVLNQPLSMTALDRSQSEEKL